MNPVDAAFAPMYGKPSWLVRQGHGSFVTLEFGQPEVDVGEARSRKVRLPEREPFELPARSAVVHGAEMSATAPFCSSGPKPPSRRSSSARLVEVSNRLSPGSSGELVDPDGHVWTIRRKRLDLRVVRNLLRRADLPLLIGEGGGFDLQWVAVGDRANVWPRIRHDYAGPGGDDSSTSRPDYMAYEFADDLDRRLLYIEVWC